MGEIITLKEIIEVIKRRFKMIIMIIILALSGMAYITFYLITPLYESSTLLLVNESLEEGKTISSSELRTNIELINTYNVIITSPRILQQVVDELSLNRSQRVLSDQINVSSEGESQVISISVKDNNPEDAMKIANSIANIFQREIIEIMNVDNVKILSPAELEKSPVSPIPIFNMTIALVIGVLGGILFVLMIEFFDNKVRSEKDIEGILPILGSVTLIDKSELKSQKLNTTFVDSDIRGYIKRGGKVES